MTEVADPRLALVGEEVTVPLVGGGHARHVNLDYAASAPALRIVHDAVEELLPWYSSIHRGSGFKSQVSTQAYELARDEIGRFVGARDDDVVVITRNTTDALNLLSSALPDDAQVLTFEGEHHANLLPWRRHRYRHLPLPDHPDDLVPILDEALATCPPERTLVAVTAVSNVTGELWPVAELAEVAARHGARTVVDAAQLAPHGPVDLAAWGADWVALSGHKLYAPYGAGALVGRRDWLEARDPFLAGGGAVLFVTLDDVVWQRAPERQEAGSPNVVGAVAMAVACRTLREVGMTTVLAHEQALQRELTTRLDTVAGLRRLCLWPTDHAKIGVATFDLPEVPYGLVAACLSAEHGLAVRDGCFCAHPLLLRLLGTPPDEAEAIRAAMQAGDRTRAPGAVRASAGLGTTNDDLDRLSAALHTLVEDGPAWSYRLDGASGAWLPDPDDREWPLLAGLGG